MASRETDTEAMETSPRVALLCRGGGEKKKQRERWSRRERRMGAINLSDKKKSLCVRWGQNEQPKKENRFVLHTSRLMNGVQKETAGER